MFAPELGGLDREQVREWYNGYRWRGAEKVYNPYDLLLLFDSGEFAAHWFETGTPAFLVDTLFERRVSTVSLDEMVSTGDMLSAFDVGSIGTEALRFQTGYLTITGEETLGGMALYRLGYPNREVRQSLNEYLLSHLVQDPARQTQPVFDQVATGAFDHLCELTFPLPRGRCGHHVVTDGEDSTHGTPPNPPAEVRARDRTPPAAV